MMAGILEILVPEMQTVDEMLKKYSQIKSGYLGDFAHLTVSTVDRYIRPACVLLAAQFANQVEKAATLAGIVQLIFLADRIHSGVSENYTGNTEPDDPRDGTQLPVLVGDYLFGRFFFTLSEAGLLEFLRPLAEIICKMNEGAMLRLKARSEGDSSPQTLLRIIEQETASLFVGACRLGFRLGKMDQNQQDALAGFGHYLGMTYGILQETGDQDLARQFSGLALESLESLKESSPVQGLRQLVYNLLGSTAPTARILVG